MMKTTIYGACLLSVISIASHAEEKQLDELTVTARPPGLQSTEHIAQPVTILRGAELSERQSSTIGETLSNIPGVTTNRFSPLASRPIIRGLGGSRVLVLENGINTLDVSTISVDHAVTVDPIQAKQIEILRGPATLIYGSEALGGLVNVVNNRMPNTKTDEFAGRAVTSYTTANNESLFAMEADGGYEKMAFHLDASNRDANNYESGSGEIVNSFYDVLNLNGGVSWVDDWGFLSLSYGYFDSTHGIPFNPDEPDELPFLETESNRTSFSGQINNPFNGIKAITIQGAYNDYSHIEFEEPGEAGTVFDNEQLDSRIQFQHEQIGGFNGVVGVQFGYRDVGAIGEEAFVPNTNIDSVAVFIVEDKDLSENLHFEIGGRYEHVSTELEDGSGDVDNDMYSISSGIHWHFREDMALGLVIGRSERAPAAEELFADGPHLATGTFELGQSNLDVESANNIDLTLTKETGRLQFATSLFVNYIQDFIFLQELDRNNDGIPDLVDDEGVLGGELLLVQFQQDDAIFYGFEAEVGYNIFESDMGILDFRLFGDYVRAERTNGDNLPRISPARIGTGFDYQYNKFTAGVDLTTFFEQDDNADLETSTGGYTDLSLNANYRLMEGAQSVSIFARGTNLLDEDGTLHTSFIKDRAPIMGRSGIIGLEATF